MNNQLIMENYLLVLKSTVEVYVHGTLESSNQDIRELLKQELSNTLTDTIIFVDVPGKVWDGPPYFSGIIFCHFIKEG